MTDVPAVLQLMRNAVALHAEDLLRTVGALALQQRDLREWSGLVERDARDLCILASAAVNAGSTLPTGLDTGKGDPDDPDSVMEGLLASHEALTRALSQLSTRTEDPNLAHAVQGVLDHRLEESEVLRALGAGRGLPKSERLVRGTLPKYQT